ncbi:hypothetical protein M1146_01160 [Patescibacteria group bacterium]|nr:hypothetical protein [Patescibacteria group bacterium]
MKIPIETKYVKRYSLCIIIIVLFIAILISYPVYAQSDYVLPYPSVMPGGISYKLHLIIEEIEKYWYFGNFGQFEYNLKESDKYLIEAKTLFEYNQYLLGSKALKKSDLYFSRIFPYLTKAKKEHKIIDSKRSLLREAAKKHIEVLSRLQREVPETFLWRPEKVQPTYLYLKKDIEQSMSIRSRNL